MTYSDKSCFFRSVISLLMKFEIPNRRTFHVIYWMFQSLIIFIGAHLILWHGEPEGFLEIFSVADYLPQYLIHVMVFFVLAIVLDHFHKQEYVKGVSSWLLPRRYVMYGVKTLVYLCSSRCPLPTCTSSFLACRWIQGRTYKECCRSFLCTTLYPTTRQKKIGRAHV